MSVPTDASAPRSSLLMIAESACSVSAGVAVATAGVNATAATTPASTAGLRNRITATLRLWNLDLRLDPEGAGDCTPQLTLTQSVRRGCASTEGSVKTRR